MSKICQNNYINAVEVDRVGCEKGPRGHLLMNKPWKTRVPGNINKFLEFSGACSRLQTHGHFQR